MSITNDDSGKIDPGKIKEKVVEKLNQPVRVWHVIVGCLFMVGADAYIRGRQEKKYLLPPADPVPKDTTTFLFEALPGDKVELPSGKVMKITADM